MQPANIGIVSFKNMPADAQGGTTVTVLFTQASATTGGEEIHNQLLDLEQIVLLFLM